MENRRSGRKRKNSQKETKTVDASLADLIDNESEQCQQQKVVPSFTKKKKTNTKEPISVNTDEEERFQREQINKECSNNKQEEEKSQRIQDKKEHFGTEACNEKGDIQLEQETESSRVDEMESKSDESKAYTEISSNELPENLNNNTVSTSTDESETEDCNRDKMTGSLCETGMTGIHERSEVPFCVSTDQPVTRQNISQNGKDLEQHPQEMLETRLMETDEENVPIFKPLLEDQKLSSHKLLDEGILNDDTSIQEPFKQELNDQKTSTDKLLDDGESSQNLVQEVGLVSNVPDGKSEYINNIVNEIIQHAVKDRNSATVWAEKDGDTSLDFQKLSVSKCQEMLEQNKSVMPVGKHKGADIDKTKSSPETELSKCSSVIEELDLKVTDVDTMKDDSSRMIQSSKILNKNQDQKQRQNFSRDDEYTDSFHRNEIKQESEVKTAPSLDMKLSSTSSINRDKTNEEISRKCDDQNLYVFKRDTVLNKDVSKQSEKSKDLTLLSNTVEENYPNFKLESDVSTSETDMRRDQQEGPINQKTEVIHTSSQDGIAGDMDMTDSQLCKAVIIQESDSVLNCCQEMKKRHLEGRKIIHDLIVDMSYLNKLLLRTKRGIENTRRKRQCPGTNRTSSKW